ncbi:3-dehydroquinate synthase [Halobacillus mangrovi]|uniref:3-dehydroquinate synthase n=1 Tax=Halobacillus mangrovi TaxID=402384 RepID=A0A1W5ZVF9_9BACI|nr:3-dehydroquinate synthase [Halobacillus mangrovi]ARI77253.1 3-dehydroquinate synthase [Halobacillus mangrovi]
MTSLMIQSSTHDYEVILKAGARRELANYIDESYRSILIISDDKVAQFYLEDVVQSLKENHKVHTSIIPSGESSKSMAQYEKLLDDCIDAQLDRKSLIIALGGGMVGDLAGFVASTYLRGIDFIQMPTTILAHDSSVGGKVAINHKKGKNMIGSFYNPVMVIYDTETLSTLSEEEIRSGYGEVIKHALLCDEEWTNELFQLSLPSLTTDQLTSDLTRGIRVKADIVEKDEKEQGLRRHLNLGHTLAHAIEAELGYGKITHGEAVAIGISFTLQLSRSKLTSNLPVIDYVNWMKENKYPVQKLQDLKPELLVERMKWDKKAVQQNIHYVLLTNIGSPCVMPVSEGELKEELKRFFEEVILT